MTTPLMPAKAGIQPFVLRMRDTVKYWVPGFPPSLKLRRTEECTRRSLVRRRVAGASGAGRPRGVLIVPRYQSRPMSAADLPLVRDWLARPHVAAWWHDADDFQFV